MIKTKNKKASSSPQGIIAKGNALYRICVIALLCLLVPVFIGFGFLIAVREPALQNDAAQRISASFATQQAVNVQQMFSHLGQRMRGAAQSPLALSAIAQVSGTDIELVEHTMLDYFPEVISLKIIPIGAMGTSILRGGSEGLRNHIEMDLVRRASIGEATRPEAYSFEGNWLISLAYLVSHPRIEGSKAVIIATIDSKLVEEEFNALDSSLGQTVLQHTHIRASGAKKTVDVASAGSGSEIDYTSYHVIADSPWTIAFTPSASLLKQVQVGTISVLSVLAIFIIAALASIAIILVLVPQTLSQQVSKLIAAADKKTALQLSVAELVPVAKQLRRATLRAVRQSSSPTAIRQTPSPDSSSAELTNPMFQSTSILDEDDVDEVLDLDLPQVTATESGINDNSIPRHIFRAYDIRGIAKTELTDEIVGKIGGALASIANEAGEQTLVVASDCRQSSPRIKSALIKALMEAGRDVIDIGTVPTPLLYFATHHLACKSGIMVTGSHNPAEYNGLKIVFNQQTIGASGIKEIRNRISTGDFVQGKGRMVREDVAPAYIDEVVGDIAIAVPLKIVLDAGNGATSIIAPELFEELGCEVVPLYCEFDGRFPNRPPDIGNENNLSGLIAKVLEEGADFGVAFDGDGDRLAVVTSSGQLIRTDTLLMLFAQDVVSRNPGCDVVFDVKCSRHLSQLITRYGGRAVLWKTGHAFMKEKMRETGALLGGEFSGHIFFGERWFGFDDGMYAAGRLAEILSSQGTSLDECLSEFPITENTPEILIPVSESNKFPLMRKIVDNADFSSGKINTIDGIRVDYKEGWGLVRASNTTAALTARFEATSPEELDTIMQEFRAQIGLVEPSLKLPF
ncbi:MAG: phosphomannomutase/phosphoglucomutase [Halioglobus sp.]|jgi:phosphomannomutase/phosphoglucomutase